MSVEKSPTKPLKMLRIERANRLVPPKGLGETNAI